MVIVLEVTYKISKKINEPNFLKTLKSHIGSAKVLGDGLVEIKLFNIGDIPIMAFLVHFQFNSDSETLFSKFEKNLFKLIERDFAKSYVKSIAA